jgi:hypothetical protein
LALHGVNGGRHFITSTGVGKHPSSSRCGKSAEAAKS